MKAKWVWSPSHDGLGNIIDADRPYDYIALEVSKPDADRILLGLALYDRMPPFNEGFLAYLWWGIRAYIPPRGPVR